MTQEFTKHPLDLPWPFWVLEVSPKDNSQVIERSYNRLTNALKLNVRGADHYVSPGGPRTRDEFLLREARSVLLDPAKRLLAEYWYIDPKLSQEVDAERSESHDWKMILKV